MRARPPHFFKYPLLGCFFATSVLKISEAKSSNTFISLSKGLIAHSHYPYKLRAKIQCTLKYHKHRHFLNSHLI